MTTPISIFIMDVSNSSKESIGDELSRFLQHLEEEITIWTKDIAPTQVIHRSGDELVVISSGYATAYTLAFYISQIWPFKEHPPYFGLSLGDIQEEVDAINIDTWIHPFMKQARLANDALKEQTQQRGLFRFALTMTPPSIALIGFNAFRSQFETLLNTIVQLQQDQVNEQTDIQALICALHVILEHQNTISQYLRRSKSTISTHLKKSKYESITGAFHDIVNVLNTLNLEDAQLQQTMNLRLQQQIKYNVSKQLTTYFTIE